MTFAVALIFCDAALAKAVARVAAWGEVPAPGLAKLCIVRLVGFQLCPLHCCVKARKRMQHLMWVQGCKGAKSCKLHKQLATCAATALSLPVIDALSVIEDSQGCQPPLSEVQTLGITCTSTPEVMPSAETATC